MADKPPLYFKKTLGALRPANTAAETALAALDNGGPVRIEIKSTRGNNRRNRLYWAMLGIAAPMLSERVTGGPLTVDLLHLVLKDRAKLYREIVLPSGEVVKDFDSISFAKMTENDRADFITFALDTLSQWLGCRVEELESEAKQAA